MAQYIALLRKDEDSDFGVEFPNFPGCVTAGTSLDDAARMAAEALAFHIEGLLEDGDEVPEPSALDVISASRDAKGAVPFLVSVADPRKRAIRVNVTFEKDVLEEIDNYAEAEGLTRSGFLSRAAVGVIQASQHRVTKRSAYRVKKKRKTVRKAARKKSA